MRYFLFFILLFSFGIIGAQVQKRMVLIGDAGEINETQKALIQHAASQVVEKNTLVLYLGDNIYPDGMPLTDVKGINEAKGILESQYVPMLKKGAQVYFLPGNHDWNYKKRDGLERVRAQADFILAQQDTNLHFLPANGCPDPVAIEVSTNSVLLYDSEWFLYPFRKQSEDCLCKTETQVFERLDELLYVYRDRLIVLASHHPMYSYGAHGGHFTWRDHIFPLTNLRRNLYVPLPLVGSLYPLLRNTIFLNAEDKPHPRYSSLVDNINKLAASHPNLIYIAGHDHGLQYIKKDKMTQIVSGGASKTAAIANGKGLQFKYSLGGYAVLDVMQDGTSHIQFYAYKDHAVDLAYEDHIPFRQIVKSNHNEAGHVYDNRNYLLDFDQNVVNLLYVNKHF